MKSKVKSKKANRVGGRQLSVLLGALFLLFTVHCSLVTVHAQSTEFTYQGRLLDSNLPPTANYDFQFSLWDALANGTQQGSTQTLTGVAVANGIFTVRLNFGAQFTGAARFLQIAVQPAGGTTYLTLAPRQSITSSPYSIKSATSTSADGLSVACNLCVTDAHILSIDGAKVTSTVANATTAVNVSGIVPIANGGTGSSTQNFVDLSTNQTNIAGNKRFVQTTTLDIANVGTLTSNGSATFNGTAVFNGGDPVQMNALNVANGLTADVTSVSELNASGSLSGNVVNSQTHFSVGGTTVLQATPDYLLLGRDTGGGAGLTRATAIGFGTQVLQSDSIVLGTTPGFFLPLPNTRVGIGVFSPTTKLDVGGQVLIRSNIANLPIGGGLRGLLNVVQTGSGDANFYMQGANGGRGINFSTNVVSGSLDARLIISHYDGTTYQNRFTISPLGDVGIGTTTPTATLDVEGTIRAGIIGIAGVTAVCFDANLVLSSCSSSGRYKKNISNFSPGLDFVRRLRAVSFNWIDNARPDVGLVAEEVAEIDARLVTYNDKGEVEGVKYDRIGVIAVNAIKEQQAQIEAQQKLIEQQQKQIDALKKLVCEIKPAAKLCIQRRVFGRRRFGRFRTFLRVMG